MGVLDLLPENQPVSLLRELEVTGNEIKSAQSLGQDSVVPHRIFSASAYDLQVAVAGTARKVAVEFTPSDMTFGGALCHRLYVRVLNTSNVDVAVVSDVHRIRTSDGTQKWELYLPPYTGTYRYKFYFFATGSGTFTANLI